MSYETDQQEFNRTASNECDAGLPVESCTNTVSLNRNCDKENRYYVCKWCDFRGLWRSKLILHMRCHHARDKPWMRNHEIPEDKSNYDGNVWQEILAQTDHGEILNCNYCLFVTSNPIELKRHVDVHSDEQPYRCLACEYKNKRKSEVKNHMNNCGHIGPILIVCKAIGELDPKIKDFILPGNVKHADIEYDYVTSEDIGKNDSKESENLTKDTEIKAATEIYDSPNVEDNSNDSKGDVIIKTQDELQSVSATRHHRDVRLQTQSCALPPFLLNFAFKA